MIQAAPNPRRRARGGFGDGGVDFVRVVSTGTLGAGGNARSSMGQVRKFVFGASAISGSILHHFPHACAPTGW